MEKYERVRTLGAGSFGKAFLVRNKDTRQLCVMKEMKCKTKADLEEAIKESKFHASVSHRNIIQYFDVFQEGSRTVFIVMEYGQGGDLQAQIKRKRMARQRFPEATIVKWLVQACMALQYLHQQGKLHRDIKAGNLFLDAKGNIKLGDFGIARVLEANAARMSARTCKTPVGTPLTMAPEIAAGKAYGQKVDIWGIGCVLYELIQLKPAFFAQSLDGLLSRIRRGKYDTRYPDHVSKDLQQLIAMMLRVDPNKRPSAARILAHPFLAAQQQQQQQQQVASHGASPATARRQSEPNHDVMGLRPLKLRGMPRRALQQQQQQQQRHQSRRDDSSSPVELHDDDGAVALGALGGGGMRRRSKAGGHPGGRPVDRRTSWDALDPHPQQHRAGGDGGEQQQRHRDHRYRHQHPQGRRSRSNHRSRSNQHYAKQSPVAYRQHRDDGDVDGADRSTHDDDDDDDDYDDYGSVTRAAAAGGGGDDTRDRHERPRRRRQAVRFRDASNDTGNNSDTDACAGDDATDATEDDEVDGNYGDEDNSNAENDDSNGHRRRHRQQRPGHRYHQHVPTREAREHMRAQLKSKSEVSVSPRVYSNCGSEAGDDLMHVSPDGVGGGHHQHHHHLNNNNNNSPGQGGRRHSLMPGAEFSRPPRPCSADRVRCGGGYVGLNGGRRRSSLMPPPPPHANGSNSSGQCGGGGKNGRRRSNSRKVSDFLELQRRFSEVRPEMPMALSKEQMQMHVQAQRDRQPLRSGGTGEGDGVRGGGVALPHANPSGHHHQRHVRQRSNGRQSPPQHGAATNSSSSSSNAANGSSNADVGGVGVGGGRVGSGVSPHARGRRSEPDFRRMHRGRPGHNGKNKSLFELAQYYQAAKLS
ncbi:NEK/NEK1 protein kinase [Salpingoeca rosetta]|uniref:non-specific serine/threonine protein kinase n=1 Tax=Salpingoeca rosetta (strain ATCC 50818 / BSB-021) TaxID=946362 RepID=F2UDG1_SALR5|nr:NEK/NEK1 protein kinase [Salpingoeca rosetta]EGD74656.1 NEK/NEK1 protein kinase [Salpingoeca rosetta]|eukprot:XP_004992913.1 NEK/NEK1 protein kinase [Salpingoeca rosetta]